MVVYKFLPDIDRCIKCTGCEVACKQQNQVPDGLRRVRVVAVNEGVPGSKNVPMPCMHCTAPPCMPVCPVKAIYKREDGVVLLSKEKCIGCGYCLYACPFGAPQFEMSGLFGSKGKMDKCTFCVEPYNQKDSSGNLIQREVKPRCSLFCATKALLGGDMQEITKIKRERAAAKIPIGTIPGA